MTDAQIEVLTDLVRCLPGEVFWVDRHSLGVSALLPVHSIQDNHKDTQDPAEIPEPVAWIGRHDQGLTVAHKCVSLWNADTSDFLHLKNEEVYWPE